MHQVQSQNISLKKQAYLCLPHALVLQEAARNSFPPFSPPMRLLAQPSPLPGDLGRLRHRKLRNPTTKSLNLLTDFPLFRGTGQRVLF